MSKVKEKIGLCVHETSCARFGNERICKVERREREERDGNRRKEIVSRPDVYNTDIGQ